MSEDNTQQFAKDGTKAQSRIFNTSIRGWIALLLSLALSLAVGLVIIAPYFKVTVPDNIAQPLVTLFISGFTAAVIEYFRQGSKEGQK